MNIIEKIKSQVKEQFPKEYACHLLFVLDIALDLQRKKGGDKDVIEIASIAHDIGRSQNDDNSQHAELGSQKIIAWLKEFKYDEERILKISRCALMHNKTGGFASIEEEIVCNADHLSKLLHLDMFMLMCKKDNYIDKAKWALKYIEKGYNNLTFQDLKQEYLSLYLDLKNRYEKVVNLK